MSNMYFQICSFVYMLMITIIFFSKKRVKNGETKIFSLLSIINVFGLILDIIIVYISYKYPNNNILYPLNKLYLIYILAWALLFNIYIFFITIDKKYKKIYIIMNLIVATVASIMVFICPLYIYNSNNIMYTEGISVNTLYLAIVFLLIMQTVIIIANIKNVFKKKYIPVLALIVLSFAGIIIRLINPSLLLTTSIITFINIFMYFTIENPDIKVIEQLNFERNRADQANKSKTDFLSNMSHEIRTPLNAIVGFSEALAEEELPATAKEELKDIISASHSLLEIVNGVLDINKIEANKIDIVNTKYDLNEILKELVSLTKSKIVDKPIELKTIFDPTIPSILYGDYTRIKQIILNLLTNAAKYTNEGNIEFKVSCVIKDDICRLIFSVEDTGIGIKKENLEKLFSEYERFDLEKNKSIEGTGLGLAITKKLVDLMNGRIIAQSIYGQGSRFTVAIDQNIISKEPIKIENEVHEKKPIDVSGKKVLVVDDNNLNLKVAKRLLDDYNLNITLVNSGTECIEKINLGEKFDLILMDDMMPNISGVETFQNLSILDNFNIPTVILTANVFTGMREKYINEEHFDDYLAKPIDREELDRVIRKFLV